ncbi:MAG TPA: hypothetical protein DCE41_17025 [Cytophagales bacterium]|nr:hypothetical protein [Cytophagales bacterium]HAA19079.1 hypothetical protein [Cytophagales bacterium]HAP64092.1 hypothetical protein [Cytophagales bacterium]
MAQFVAFNEQVEFQAGSLLALVGGLSDTFKAKIFEIAEDAGFTLDDPQAWLPWQVGLDMYQEIYDLVGEATLFSMGKAIPEMVPLPPVIDSLEKVLHSINEAYKMSHRGDNIGYYKVVKFDANEREAIIEAFNPYPGVFDRGLITGFARRFKPEDSEKVEVELDDTKPSREIEDADKSFYVINW